MPKFPSSPKNNKDRCNKLGVARRWGWGSVVLRCLEQGPGMPPSLPSIPTSTASQT